MGTRSTWLAAAAADVLELCGRLSVVPVRVFPARFSRKGLYLIDPRGVIGDVEYDAAVVCIKARLDVRDLARKLQVDASRVESWATIAAAARV